jgi:hypothetical protein
MKVTNIHYGLNLEIFQLFTYKCFDSYEQFSDLALLIVWNCNVYNGVNFIYL